MTPLTVVLANIATLEAARDALPSHSHIAALFSLTLYRLEEEAEAMRRGPQGGGITGWPRPRPGDSSQMGWLHPTQLSSVSTITRSRNRGAGALF